MVDEASRLGLPAIALTDRDSVYGVVRAHVKARELGMKVIIGSQVPVADGSTIVYAHMQPTGMVNDHVDRCFRRAPIIQKYLGS